MENPDGTFNPVIPDILPHEQMYTIQVGGETFRLSGASLSSDAPSYFTEFFTPYKNVSEEERPTLYIDRSAEVFKLISNHLQGYYTSPRDYAMYIYLAADATYYHLPRLLKQIRTADMFVNVGGECMRVPHKLFQSPGDVHNFFTISRAALLDDRQVRQRFNLLRPPPMAPLVIPERSAKLFGEILELLKGAYVNIEDGEHRQKLINECKYYRLRGLEQKLLPVKISVIGEDASSVYEEIQMNLKDVKLSNLCVGQLCGRNAATYQRPFTEEPPRELVFQLRDDLVKVQQHDGTVYDCIFLKEETREMVQNALQCLTVSDMSLGESHSDLMCGFQGVPTNGAIASLTLDGKELGGPLGPGAVCFLKDSLWRFAFFGADGRVYLELVKGCGISQGRQNAVRDFV
ncbi:hypothetical protein TRVA0_010S03224 [Trichomonascus vanleenenianus]|uniref:uncharacterized protein n=1 Tax=Trichomonascus vanleenenianus TaxID=2268995 RepID=UPI003EC9DB69